MLITTFQGGILVVIMAVHIEKEKNGNFLI